MPLTIASLCYFLFTSCVTIPGKSFYESRISKIEVNTLNYEKRRNLREEVDKFEKEVVEKLKSKGYQAFVGQRIINNELTVWGVAEKLAPNSTADAFMILDWFGLGKARLYQNGKYVGDTLFYLNPIYWMYNRQGERILQSSDKFLWHHSDVIKRKGEKVWFQPGFILSDINNILNMDPESGTYIPIETEEEFRSRVAAEFTSNIPNACLLQVDAEQLIISPVDISQPTAPTLSSPSKSEAPKEPMLDPSGPWTGKWIVEGSPATGGIWALKQEGDMVSSTGESRYRVRGILAGDSLKGDVFIAQRWEFPFNLALSQDGNSFDGYIDDRTGTKRIIGKKVE